MPSGRAASVDARTQVATTAAGERITLGGEEGERIGFNPSCRAQPLLKSVLVTRHR
jgi:hypothetical protein